MDFSEQSGSESSRQRRKKKKKIKERIKKEERDDVLRKLAKSGMTTQKRATSSRPMDEVEVTYNNKRNTPLSLAEMLSILLKKPENAVSSSEVLSGSFGGLLNSELLVYLFPSRLVGVWVNWTTNSTEWGGIVVLWLLCPDEFAEGDGLSASSNV